MNGPETAAIDNMVKRIQRGIEVQSRKDFHIEKFEIRSKNKGTRQRLSPRFAEPTGRTGPWQCRAEQTTTAVAANATRINPEFAALDPGT
jgi:hypothetical protein